MASLLFSEFESFIARYDAITQIRTERALDAMSQQGRQVFELLPVLLHFNHPLLPGYVSGDVPHGVATLTLSPSQQQFIDDLCLVTNSYSGIHSQQESILGIYSMGSTSSIGQCERSDLDIWVCHDHGLSPEQVQLLEHKCLLISKLAEHRGVELNCFLIPDNKFRLENQAEVRGDNCGSTQHLLLLDEFYRSALRIAGKRLLWPLVPLSDGEGDAGYDERVAELIREGLDPDQWLDLGGVGDIPAKEYFGSALWLLYKGLDSPYKAVLKILLMEAYSAEFPHTLLLSVEAKQWFQQHDVYGRHLDPYFLMLQKVTRYLESNGDDKRLDLVRRCFYIKISEGLNQSADPGRHVKRRAMLKELVAEWGWSDEKLDHLDNRAAWKVVEVKAAYAELVDALMQSYGQLIQFARRHNISDSINAEDIGVLSRKLYAAFETLPGKVQRINLKIAPDLQERDLSFIQVPPGRMNRQGWYLYKFGLKPVDIIGRAPLEYHAYISKLVAWAHFNGLLTETTRVHLRGQGSDLTDLALHQFCHDLATSFPVRLPPASNLALSRPCEIRHLGIYLNLELDPTSHWQSDALQFDSEHCDVLAFGQQQECLIGSVDLVYRNSWNEIRTLHFSGPEAVVEALATILGKMPQDAAMPEAIDVLCYSLHFRGLIRQQFNQLVSECLELWLAHDKQRLVKMLALGKERYALFVERRGVSIKRLDSAIDFYRQISDNKLERQPVPAADQPSGERVPAVVDSYASEGLIQFFIEDRASGFNVYVLDEHNQVEIYRDYSGSKDDLVQSVNRYYTMTHERFSRNNQFINFNLPQFYEVLQRGGVQQVVPFRSHSREPA